MLVIFLCARALDLKGSGRVADDDVAQACCGLVSDRQMRRILNSVESSRYWTRDRGFLRLNSEARILASYPGELLGSVAAIRVPLALLDSRARRGAALLAAIVAGADDPRSNQFVGRFSKVDRKTISRWMKDPVIRMYILRRVPNWSEA